MTFWIGWAFAIFIFVFIGVVLECSRDRIPREFGNLFLGLAGGLTFLFITGGRIRWFVDPRHR